MRLNLAQMASETDRSDWDDEGGAAIPEDIWMNVDCLLDTLAVLNVPEPFVSPCGDGSVHLAWVTGDGSRLRLEVGPHFAWCARTCSRVIGGGTNV